MGEKVELTVECKESVALKIASEIASREKMYGDDAEFRKKFLDLYAECLQATSNQRRFSS